jgi:hypothetical protein
MPPTSCKWGLMLAKRCQSAAPELLGKRRNAMTLPIAVPLAFALLGVSSYASAQHGSAARVEHPAIQSNSFGLT